MLAAIVAFHPSPEPDSWLRCRARQVAPSGAPADEADARDELRLDRDDLVAVAGDPRLGRGGVARGGGVGDEAGHAGDDHGPAGAPYRVEFVGLIADDRALRAGPAVGRAGRDRRP